MVYTDTYTRMRAQRVVKSTAACINNDCVDKSNHCIQH